MTPPANPERYKNHRYPGEIISHGVWLDYRFTLSYRGVQEFLMERGLTVSHEAIRQWCGTFGRDYAKQLRRRRPRPGDKWHLDVRELSSTYASAGAAHAGLQVARPCPAFSVRVWAELPALSTAPPSAVGG